MDIYGYLWFNHVQSLVVLDIYGSIMFNHWLFMVFHRWALGSTFPPVLEISHNWSRMGISKSVGQAGQAGRTAPEATLPQR